MATNTNEQKKKEKRKKKRRGSIALLSNCRNRRQEMVMQLFFRGMDSKSWFGARITIQTYTVNVLTNQNIPQWYKIRIENVDVND